MTLQETRLRRRLQQQDVFPGLTKLSYDNCRGKIVYIDTMVEKRCVVKAGHADMRSVMIAG